MAGFSYEEYKKKQAEKKAAGNQSAVPPTPTAPKPTGNIGNAFWINPYGKILDIGQAKHITSMVKAPEKFGFTKDEIIKRHADYNEPVGIEGKAREDMIKDVMQRGFIHIRLYPNKFWAVNLWRYSKKAKKALSVWAEEAMNHPQSGKHMAVRVYSLEKNEIVAQQTIQDLYFGMDEAVDGFNPYFVESIEDFETMRRQTFIEFLTD